MTQTTSFYTQERIITCRLLCGLKRSGRAPQKQFMALTFKSAVYCSVYTSSTHYCYNEFSFAANNFFPPGCFACFSCDVLSTALVLSHPQLASDNQSSTQAVISLPWTSYPLRPHPLAREWLMLQNRVQNKYGERVAPACPPHCWQRWLNKYSCQKAIRGVLFLWARISLASLHEPCCFPWNSS